MASTLPCHTAGSDAALEATDGSSVTAAGSTISGQRPPAGPDHEPAQAPQGPTTHGGNQFIPGSPQPDEGHNPEVLPLTGGTPASCDELSLAQPLDEEEEDFLKIMHSLRSGAARITEAAPGTQGPGKVEEIAGPRLVRGTAGHDR